MSVIDMDPYDTLCPTLRQNTRFRFFSFVVAFSILASTLLPAIGQTPSSPIHLFQGTKTEQAACSSDAVKLCGEDMPDPVRVLACLKNFRRRLNAACRHALDQHGL